MDEKGLMPMMAQTNPLEVISGYPLRYEFEVTPGHAHKGLTMRWGGREVLLHEIPIETPSYPYVMLKYCEAGAGTLRAGDSVLEVEPGMFFWTNVRHPSTLIASADLGMVNYAIALGGREAEAHVARFLHADVGAVRIGDRAPLEMIVKAIMEEGCGTSEHREEICAMLAGVLLRRVDAQALSPLRSNSLARSTFKRCREYIERHFATLTTLGEVADACEVTVPYLCRLFEQFFRCSPYDYMTQLKMSRAENLLLRPLSPVREVALAVGYKNARLFARNFKAAYGKNPTDYRRAHAKPGTAVANDEG